jgi:hypothetical protein
MTALCLELAVDELFTVEFLEFILEPFWFLVVGGYLCQEAGEPDRQANEVARRELRQGSGWDAVYC